MYRHFGKRLVDLLLVLLTSPLWLLLCGVLAVVVRVKLGGPVFFRQERPGLGGKIFRLCKFRSMTDERDEEGNLLPDAQRLTPLGQFLRSSSLDELPSLWNVLRGDLSLVGPRPLLTRYLSLYAPEQARRHEVRPGITGWAQVNGRNLLDWDGKFRCDVWYVKRCSLWLDLQILCRTVLRVVQRNGISAADHATVPEFIGSPGHQRVLVIGAGGHAKVVIAALQAAGRAIEAVYDDDCSLWGRRVLGVPVTGPVSALSELPGRDAVIAIGSNRVRRSLAETLDLNWVCVVHPAAQVHESVKPGPGTVICAGAVIQPDVTIGRHTIVNTSASVDHDCRLEDFVHVAPGCRLAGNVTVNAGALLGIGSVAIPGIVIGAETTVGAGATVVGDLPGGIVAVGCPARALNHNISQRAA